MNEQDIIATLSLKYDSKQILKLIHLDKQTGPVFRTLNKSSYKESFLNGEFRISTLDSCRKLENDDAKDIDEGKFIAYFSNLYIDSTDNNKHFDNIENLKKMGIYIKNCSGIQVSNINSAMMLNDAYVLCFSTEITKYNNDIFGQYSICINYPNLFAYIIYENIKNTYSVFEYKCKAINYGDQKADILDSNISDHLGFHKTKKFEIEKEFRMLFISHSRNINPIILKIPEISLICSNVDL